jgi:hypothetical protein
MSTEDGRRVIALNRDHVLATARGLCDYLGDVSVGYEDDDAQRIIFCVAVQAHSIAVAATVAGEHGYDLPIVDVLNDTFATHKLPWRVVAAN